MLKATLWSAWASSGGLATPTPLRDYMVNQAVITRQLVAAGRIKSNNANGHITEFMAEGLTPEDIISAWVYLVELFDTGKAELVAAGNATPSESQIKDQMENVLLRSIQGYTDNYMYLMK